MSRKKASFYRRQFYRRMAKQKARDLKNLINLASEIRTQEHERIEDAKKAVKLADDKNTTCCSVVKAPSKKKLGIKKSDFNFFGHKKTTSSHNYTTLDSLRDLYSGITQTNKDIVKNYDKQVVKIDNKVKIIYVKKQKQRKTPIKKVVQVDTKIVDNNTTLRSITEQENFNNYIKQCIGA